VQKWDTAQFASQPLPNAPLCQPLVYNFSMLSTLAADLRNPRLQVTIPTGRTLTTVRIEYPSNSGSYQTVTPDAAAATLSVYDVTGKVVSVRNINANKGLNSEVFTRA
jgi:hypothetical protein